MFICFVCCWDDGGLFYTRAPSLGGGHVVLNFVELRPFLGGKGGWWLFFDF